VSGTNAALATWRRVGAVDPAALVDARLQLHHALQIAVSAPISYLAPRPDDSHTNLEWLPALEALGTHWLLDGKRLHFALRPATLELLAVDDGGVTSQYALHGRTVSDAVGWLRESLASAGYDAARLTTTKHYDIPAHAVAAGRVFARDDPAAFAELARYYENAHDLTAYVAATRAGAPAPRCWPHHFDIATLIVLPELSGRGTRTVGVGLSPGDDSYAEPYFYVGPYPYPDHDRLKPLGSLGTWHTTRWVGAVLRGSEIVRIATADAQAQAVLGFANSAIEASIEALARV
jgi:hypothetical protein